MVFTAATDSWVYILFGILWVVFAVYKGNKKAASQTKKTVEEVSEPLSASFEKIMDTFSSEEQEKAEETVQERVPEDEKEEAGEGPQTITPADEGIRTTVSEEKPLEVSPPPKSRKINLRQAIIYSEILRRPYE